jgi:hypothetical protein
MSTFSRTAIPITRTARSFHSGTVPLSPKVVTPTGELARQLEEAGEEVVAIPMGPRQVLLPASRVSRQVAEKLRSPPPGHTWRTARVPFYIAPKHVSPKAWRPLEERQKHLAEESPKRVLQRIRKEIEKQRENERQPDYDWEEMDQFYEPDYDAREMIRPPRPGFPMTSPGRQQSPFGTPRRSYFTASEPGPPTDVQPPPPQQFAGGRVLNVRIEEIRMKVDVEDLTLPFASASEAVDAEEDEVFAKLP